MKAVNATCTLLSLETSVYWGELPYTYCSLSIITFFLHYFVYILEVIVWTYSVRVCVCVNWITPHYLVSIADIRSICMLLLIFLENYMQELLFINSGCTLSQAFCLPHRL